MKDRYIWPSKYKSVEICESGGTLSITARGKYAALIVYPLISGMKKSSAIRVA